jgi:heme-degrading monooxygenase HmoA
MIARVWHGATVPGDAAAYLDHLRTATLPELRAIDGHYGAYVLRQDDEAATEFIVITLWESVEAIRAFAGDNLERAVVPPAAAKLLRRYDDRVVHYDVAVIAGAV